MSSEQRQSSREREEGEDDDEQGVAVEEVAALAADLASRQAETALQRPHMNRTASSTTQDNDGKVEESSKGRGSSDEGRLSVYARRSPTLLRRPSGTASTYKSDDAPRIDEAAIYEMTQGYATDDEEGGDKADSAVVDEDPTSPKRIPASMTGSARSIPRSASSRSRLSKAEELLEDKKRMTVLLDDEEIVSDEDEDEDEDEDDSAKALSQHDSNATAANEPEIVEQDADVGDVNVAEAQTVSSEGSVPDKVPEKPDLAQSMATLRAAREGGPGRADDAVEDDIAHAEQASDAGSDEDEEEPSLKYSRLRGSVPDMLKRDSASALAVSDRFLALGTHGGSIYILDEQGNLIKGFRTHSASVLALVIDSTSEFVGSAGMDGLVSVAALSSSESYTFDFKRVMRSVALEPSFGVRSSRAFVCGGMSGQLVLREKSWFGHREVILHEGEGPIWTTQWRGSLIAWANDKGVRIYDTASKQRITFISPPEGKPRADLFRCTLYWQDDATLIIAWGDTIKVAKIRHQRDQGAGGKVATAVLPSNSARPKVEITAILQLDCMISGLAPRGKDYLILAYLTDDDFSNEEESLPDLHKRRDGQRPELRLISNDGEELSSDVLSMQSFARFQCNDYLLVPSSDAVLNGAAALANSVTNHKHAMSTEQAAAVSQEDENDYFYVVSPKDVVVARSRDQKDHIEWLLQHRHYQEALEAVEALGDMKARSFGFDANVVGATYLNYLIYDKQDWQKASDVGPGILKDDVQAWEDVIFAFVDKKALQHLLGRVPIVKPRLNTVVYDMILAYLLQHDLPALLDCIKAWPVDIYGTQAVVLALEDKLGHKDSGKLSSVAEDFESEPLNKSPEHDSLIMECLAEIHLRNRQPGKALPYYLRLRKPGVFDLIRDHNLFTDVQDQALLLVEFEDDLSKLNGGQEATKAGAKVEEGTTWQSIELLVDHTHSIPIHRVVPQLQSHRKYLFFYLDALFNRDPQLVATYSDVQVELYAEFAYDKLMGYLRTMSSYYSFEKAYNICKSLDYVPEMVFLLSRIGDNKTALMLIIERLGDVERAIAFVKEEKDPELWENLVTYSEDKPNFIRGLLENVGGEVDAVKLIRRIKNDLHIEGLRDALIKILGDFNLQISLLEGCASILTHDGQLYAQQLQRGQTGGMYGDADVRCATCKKSLLSSSNEAVATRDTATHDEKIEPISSTSAPAAQANAVFFLCRHAHHLTCLLGDKAPPTSTRVAAKTDAQSHSITMTTTRALASGSLYEAATYGPMQRAQVYRQQIQEKVRLQARLRVVLRKGCPVCHANQEQFRI